MRIEIDLDVDFDLDVEFYLDVELDLDVEIDLRVDLILSCDDLPNSSDWPGYNQQFFDAPVRCGQYAHNNYAAINGFQNVTNYFGSPRRYTAVWSEI